MDEQTKQADRAEESTGAQDGSEASPEPTAESGASLQFEKAEFDDAPAAPTCSSCQRPVAPSYWQVGDSIVCAPCRDDVVRAIEAGKGRARFFGAVRLGALAAVVGSIVWYAIREVTGYEIGLVAIGVGILVGAAVKRGSGGFGGRRYQALAVFLTYASISMTNVPAIVKAIDESASADAVDLAAAPPAAPAGTAAPAADPQDPASPADPPPGATTQASVPAPSLLGFLAACGLILLIAFAAPFLAGFENILGILIIGFGLYEAWKINKYQPPSIQGPFEVGAARGGEAVTAVSDGG